MLAAQPVAPVPVAAIRPEDDCRSVAPASAVYAFSSREPAWGAGRRKRVSGERVSGER
jgi:hypothetical protein